MAPLRRLVRPTLASLRREKFFHREDGVAREHVVHRAPDLVGEDRERFPFAVAPFESRLEPLALSVLAQERDRGLGKRPFEMDIALLRASPGRKLASARLSCTSNRPASCSRRFPRRHEVKTSLVRSLWKFGFQRRATCLSSAWCAVTHC